MPRRNGLLAPWIGHERKQDTEIIMFQSRQWAVKLPKKKEPYTSKHLFWLTLWLPNFSWIPGTQSIAKLQILTQCQEKTTPASPISTTSQESIALYTYWHQKKQIKRKELNKVEGFRGYSIFTTDNSTINWKPPIKITKETQDQSKFQKLNEHFTSTKIIKKRLAKFSNKIQNSNDNNNLIT